MGEGLPGITVCRDWELGKLAALKASLLTCPISLPSDALAPHKEQLWSFLLTRVPHIFLLAIPQLSLVMSL